MRRPWVRLPPAPPGFLRTARTPAGLSLAGVCLSGGFTLTCAAATWLFRVFCGSKSLRASHGSGRCDSRITLRINLPSARRSRQRLIVPVLYNGFRVSDTLQESSDLVSSCSSHQSPPRSPQVQLAPLRMDQLGFSSQRLDTFLDG